MQTEFSGEVPQAKRFSQRIVDGVTFSVDPMQLRNDPKHAWFVIRVIGDDASSFVLKPSDANWILAASGFWAAFIGGPQADLRKALGYQSRHLLLPLSVEDKEKAREAAKLVEEAKTADQEQRAIAAFNGVRIGQAQFQITDYALGDGEPPISVEWVSFRVILTLPFDFAASSEFPVSVVDCPEVPADTIENLRNPHRHEYLLSR